MAIIKVRHLSYVQMNRKSGGAPTYASYVMDKATEYSSESVLKDQLIENFKATQEAHGKFQGNNFAFEITQNFPHWVSKPENVEKINEMGVKLAQEMYPGYEVGVATHTDKEHFHNHILVNPVHPETGKRLDRGDFQRWKVIPVSNQIVEGYGFPIPKAIDPTIPAKIHPAAKRLLKRGKIPVQFDLIRKLDVARSISRDLEEFKRVLSFFGIDVRVENKNISFLHPERSRRNRGKSLGNLYHLNGLEGAFKQVRQKHFEDPQKLFSTIEKLQQEPDLKTKDFKVPRYIELLEGGHIDILKDIKKSLTHERFYLKSRYESQNSVHRDVRKLARLLAAQKDLNRNLDTVGVQRSNGTDLLSELLDFDDDTKRVKSKELFEEDASGIKPISNMSVLVAKSSSRKVIKSFFEKFPGNSLHFKSANPQDFHDLKKRHPGLQTLSIYESGLNAINRRKLITLASSLKGLGVSATLEKFEPKTKGNQIEFDLGM